MKKTLLTFVISCITATLVGQVGINTTTPSTALDVVGDVKLDTSLFLENPGNSTQIRGSKLLIQTTSDEILQYDIEQSKYGPINQVQFIFRSTSKDGLQDYDTKIAVSDYLVTVQGYYFLEPGSGDTDVMPYSSVDGDNIEGFQMYAYPNPSTGTWFLRGTINNGVFRTRNPSGIFIDTPIDLFMNLIIYRKDFITKSVADITVDLGNSETGTAPIPPGF